MRPFVRNVSIVATVLLLIGVGAALYFWPGGAAFVSGLGSAESKRSLPGDYELTPISILRGEARTQALELYEDWVGNREYAPLTLDDQALIERLRPSLHDPDGLLSEGQEQALLEALMEQLRIRSSPSPEKYRAFVDSSPLYRWTRDGESGSLIGVWRFLWDEDPPEGGGAAAFDRYWAHSIVERRNRIAGVGVGPLGSKLSVMRKYNDELSPMLGLTREELPLFSGLMATVNPVRFMRATKSLDEVIEEHGSALAAESHVLLRLENGGVVNWFSVWALDPESGRWFIHLAEFKRATYAEFFF